MRAKHAKSAARPRNGRTSRLLFATLGAILGISVVGMGTAFAYFSYTDSSNAHPAEAVAGAITAATGFTASSVTASSAVLSWTAPAGYTPTNWTITQTSPAGSVTGTCSGTEPSSGCNVTGLSRSTAYTWTLTYFYDSWQATTTTSTTTLTPTITLGTTTGVTVGSTDTVSGTGFPASTPVSLSWDGAGVPFTATTSGTGSFAAASFTVPQAVAGSHTVGAAAGISYATASLTVVPKITVKVGSGVAGTTASVSGTGFASGVTPTATFNGSALTLGGPGDANTDTFGAFNDATFTIPSIAAGSYTLAVTAGTGDTANFSFTVVSATGYTSISSFTATQTSGTMSGLITVSGTGPNKNEALEVYVDGIDTGQTVNTGSNKAFGGNGGVATFGLPAGIINGTNLVSVIDTTGMVDGTATLSLTGVLTASPTAGAPGTSVTVTGAAHTTSASLVTFSTFFDSTALVTGTTSTTNGATSSSFTVPSGWGTHLVYLEQTSSTDNGYFTPAINFSVPEPTMTATPTGGFVSGHTVTPAGSGFANSSVLSATYAGSSVTLSGTTTTTATGGIATGTPPTFTLPTESAGTYPLIVTDSKGNSFTVGINQTG
jgi:hypothetical protein